MDNGPVKVHVVVKKEGASSAFEFTLTIDSQVGINEEEVAHDLFNFLMETAASWARVGGTTISFISE